MPVGIAGLALDSLPRSRASTPGAEWALTRQAGGLRLVVLARAEGRHLLDGLEGETTSETGGTLLVGPASPRNAAALRRHLDWLRPRPPGARTSAGVGGPPAHAHP